MAHARYTSEEIARRGKKLYEERIRALVETAENFGKVVSIDIETGDYNTDCNVLLADEKLHLARPGAAVWTERIGYESLYSLGGRSITRLAKRCEVT